MLMEDLAWLVDRLQTNPGPEDSQIRWTLVGVTPRLDVIKVSLSEADVHAMLEAFQASMLAACSPVEEMAARPAA